MNITNFKTKQDLDDWAEKCLVVYEIRKSPDTGFDRVAVLMKFEAAFLSEQVIISVGIFELDANGNPIIGRSLAPYEEIILADNNSEVDMETFQIVPKELQDPNKLYMGEYNAYIYLTKNSQIELWELFKSAIKNSTKLKILS